MLVTCLVIGLVGIKTALPLPFTCPFLVLSPAIHPVFLLFTSRPFPVPSSVFFPSRPSSPFRPVFRIFFVLSFFHPSYVLFLSGFCLFFVLFPSPLPSFPFVFLPYVLFTFCSFFFPSSIPSPFSAASFPMPFLFSPAIRPFAFSSFSCLV